MLQNKKILIAVTGSIAAYKIATLVRLLVKENALVKVVMTDAAQNFISALTLSTLSKNEVHTSLSSNNTWANHVMLGLWADVMLVAPASCNTLSKMANGNCDNILQAVYLSARCPILIAPAMDEDMWKHPSTKSNIEKVKSFGNIILPVNNGELASGLIGEGRMAEPEFIFDFLKNFFSEKQELLNKKILITAGPTYEQLDPVRFIGNYSTGKMGIAIAKACANKGGDVTLVLGPSSEIVPDNIKLIRVKSSSEMLDACLLNFENTDIAIMSAAVADYTPVNVAEQKIKKNDGLMTLELKKTEDILKMLGSMKTDKQLLVGFALETENEKENALKKMKSKNADFIILNSLNDTGAGFAHNTNKITIFDSKGNQFDFETKSKDLVALDIVQKIITG